MRILVNGVRLFVDVANPGLVPDGDRMREKSTLLMLHGGPGLDHAHFKDAFSALSDVAQVIFYDHRGNGRSEGDDPSAWNLAQWGDDVKGLCDALGVVKPIVCGMSFGGFVAMSYATRHPPHPGKLILLSTAAKTDFPAVFENFTRIGGPEIGALAESYWTNPTVEGRAIYLERCMPFYRHRRDRPTEPMRDQKGRSRAPLQWTGKRTRSLQLPRRSGEGGVPGADDRRGTRPHCSHLSRRSDGALAALPSGSLRTAGQLRS
jgi:proline iminopeptidase